MKPCATLTDAMIGQMLDEVHQAALDAMSQARMMGIVGEARRQLIDASRYETVRSYLCQAGITSHEPEGTDDTG